MPAEKLSAHVKATVGDFSIEVSLELSPGITALLGPSGSGKTTTLRCLAGLQPMQGHVTLDGIELTRQPPEKRSVGYVFQHAALFPHLTVLENVRFSGATDVEALRWLERWRVGSLGGRKPETLSGGERQRVALARTFASKPKWLLLDEPFSSVDEELRLALLDELKAIVAQEKWIALLVTHARSDVEKLEAKVLPLPSGEGRGEARRRPER